MQINMISFYFEIFSNSLSDVVSGLIGGGKALTTMAVKAKVRLK